MPAKASPRPSCRAKASPARQRARASSVDHAWRDTHEWYSASADYWASTPPTNNGVLGGLGAVHKADTADSLRFARQCLPEGRRPARALDVAAGIGRVTGATLLQLCDCVDLHEGDQAFVARAKADLAWAGSRVERFICSPMQSFVPEPGRYDLIWIQWCIGHLTDDDLIAFMLRCRAALAPGGLIVIKDNCVVDEDDPSALIDGRYLLDAQDKSVIRSLSYTEKLLCERAGLKLLARAPAALRRPDLHPVINFALVAPAAGPGTSSNLCARIAAALFLVLLWLLLAGSRYYFG